MTGALQKRENAKARGAELLQDEKKQTKKKKTQQRAELLSHAFVSLSMKLEI